MRACWLLVLGGCSFQHGSLAGSGSGDDAAGGDDARLVDASTIDTPPAVTCFAKWKAGPTLSQPAMFFGISTTLFEGDPFLTADEKTIYFLRSGDVYKATRTSLSNDFSGEAKANDLSSAQIDSKVTITHDGLTVFFDSARTGGTGGATDLWRATRTSTSNLFGTPSQMYLGALNTSSDQWDPHVSADGLRLYFAPMSGTSQHIVMASRATSSDAFGAPVTISELDSGEIDNDPTLTLDERVIVFASDRGNDRNIWYAVRDEPTQPFGAPIMVPIINTDVDDGPHISNDGCRLYFVSYRDGDDDIWGTDVL